MTDQMTQRMDGSAPHDEVVAGPYDTVDRALPESDASLSELLSRLVSDFTLLFRQELQLAKDEFRQEATRAGKAGGMLAAGGVLAFVALLLLAWAAAWGLASVLPTAVAFLLVGIVFAAVAAGVLASGRKKLAEIDLVPHQTIDSIQKDQQTITDRSSR